MNELPLNLLGETTADRDLWGRLTDVAFQRDVLAGALRTLVATLRPLPLYFPAEAWGRVLDARNAAEKALAELDGPPPPPDAPAELGAA